MDEREEPAHGLAPPPGSSGGAEGGSPGDDWWTLPQVAAALGLALSTVHRRLRSGRLVGHRHGWAWLVHRTEVERALAAGGRLPPGPRPQPDSARQRRLARQRTQEAGDE